MIVWVAEAALRHPNAATMSTRTIAEWCGVSHTFVNNLRPSVNRLQMDSATERIVTRGNSTYTINTANIARTRMRHMIHPTRARHTPRTRKKALLRGVSGMGGGIVWLMRQRQLQK